jgi:hypothetical protein
MKPGAIKSVNYSKVQGIIHKQKENITAFYDRLGEEFRKHS